MLRKVPKGWFTLRVRWFEGICQLYELYGEKMKIMHRERDLGVIMDETLSYRAHIETIINKAMKTYGWLSRNLVTRDPVVVVKVYKTLIRPTLEYASSVWSPSRVGMIQKLEKVQRKITKLICRDGPYPDRLRRLRLPTLLWRRHYLDLLRVYQIIHGDEQLRKRMFTFSAEVSQSNLRRHKHTIYKAKLHTDVYKHHFINRVTDHWNSLPAELLDAPRFSLFKSKLKAHLLATGAPYE